MAADNVDAITISAGLSNTVLTTPPIGTNASGSVGYNNGDLAMDAVKNATGASAGAATALHSALGGTGGVILIVNPTDGLDVVLYVDSTTLGTLTAGTPCVMPVSATAVIKAGCATNQNIGVSVIKTTANA